MPSFGSASLARLDGVDERLQALCHLVVEDYDCSVLTGVRTRVKQEQCFDQGLSRVHWPNSFHNVVTPTEAYRLRIIARPQALAVDLAPYPIRWDTDLIKVPGGPLDREALENLRRFYHFAGYVQGRAAQMGLAILWGGDWDRDQDFADQKFMDLVHFQLVPPT